MSVFDAFNIGASGLSAERFRMNLVASNLANANAARSEEGGPYRRRDAVFAALPYGETEKGALSKEFTGPLAKVGVVGVDIDQRDPRRVYDPGHPDADSAGYVSYPNINVVEEMVNLINAQRSYEANAAGIDSAKQMALRALEIGRG